MNAELRKAIDRYRQSGEARLAALKGVHDATAAERVARSQSESAAKDEAAAFRRLLGLLGGCEE